jgi:NitT/TauT family transport system substrate-binding protein
MMSPLRRSWAARLALAPILLALGAAPALALDQLKFGIDWKAEAEYGGYYQAKATGLYAKYGLEVEIRQGGPQVNHPQLLAAGVIDISISSNSSVALNFVARDIPMVTIAAFFQKDPAVLIAHADTGVEDFPAMKGHPILISTDTREGWWLFLKAQYGFEDSQIRPYTFQMAPFLADRTAIQQGYVTSEPHSLEAAGAKLKLFLIADAGWPSYGSLITTSAKLAHEKPELVQRFLDASIEGWYSYLYGDPTPGNALIAQDNPEMTAELIAYGIAKLKSNGIIDSGDALQAGIGAMTPERIEAFLKVMSDAGIYPKTLDWKKGFNFDFVNKKHGLDLKRALQAK